MSRGAWLLLAALLAIVGAIGPARAAELHLTESAGSDFPNKTFALTLANPSDLRPGQVTLRENGVAVSGLSVTAASASRSARIGTMLVIDTSRSMHGASILAAMDAARAFAQQRSPQQSLGLVFFNGGVRVAVPPTKENDAAMARALAATPPLAPGTHVLDATSQAIQELARAHATSGNVIVLSDGKDTGSIASRDAITSAARAAHARIYAVGFRDRAYDPATLTRLATDTNGQYVAASSQQALKDLYTSLGKVLANQYIVTYRSTAPLASTIHVEARVTGQPGLASESYTTPRVARAAVSGHHAGATSFWHSDLAVALIVGACTLLLGFAVAVLLVPGRSVRSRVGQFVALPSPEEGRDWTRTLLQRAFGGETQTARRRRRRGALADELELAGVTASPMQIGLWTLGGALLLGWLMVSSTGAAGAAVMALFVPLAVRIGIRVRVARQRRAFDEQLPDNLQVVASAMRSGQTFLGSLSFVAADAPEPSQREFRRILADERIGIPLEDALITVATRMRSRDFEYVALVATLQRQTGGNTAEVIDQVTETIRERMDLRRIVRSLTAQGRLAGFVVSALPVLLIIVISFVNPDYVYPMFHTAGGVFMLVIGALMLAAGAKIISRIVDIKV